MGTYVDKKCPFTGNVSIRGRILKGIVVSTKMTRTLIIRRDYLHWVSKYKRCVRLKFDEVMVGFAVGASFLALSCAALSDRPSD